MLSPTKNWVVVFEKALGFWKFYWLSCVSWVWFGGEKFWGREVLVCMKRNFTSGGRIV